MTNSRAVFIAPILSLDTHAKRRYNAFLATQVVHIGKRSLHLTFTELHSHIDECWPIEVASMMYFCGVE